MELVYDNRDCILYPDGRMTRQCSRSEHGRIQTIVVEKNKKILTTIREIAKENPDFIPECANSYVVSDYNKNTTFVKDGKEYSVYAIQFYGAFY